MRTCIASLVIVIGITLIAAPLDAQSSRPKGGSDATAKTGSKIDVGAFSFPLGKDWTQQKTTSRMRVAQASLPGVDDAAAAELVVFNFPGTGGTVEANVTRWKGQFEKPEGMKEEEFAKQRSTTVDGLPVTILEVRGRYVGSAMPGRPAPKPMDDARMLAVIVETSKGPFFIKVTGPRATIDHHKKALDALIEGVKRGPKEPEGKKQPTSRPKG